VLTSSLNVVQAIIKYLIQRKLDNTIGSWFICQISSNSSGGKADPAQDLKFLLETSK